MRKRKHNIDSLIALVLFGVFATCILSVLLTGADAYRRLTARDQESFATRTCLQYVVTKVRQAGSGENVYLSDFDGVNTLCISENISERTFVTRIYCYDGWLMEIFSSSTKECHPDEGEEVLRADGLDFKLEDGILTIELADGEEKTGVSLSLRGEGDNDEK